MIPRLFVDAPLQGDSVVALSADQAHYLKNVLRRTAGDEVRLFNGKDGEYAGVITEFGKKTGAVAVGQQSRAQEEKLEITLCFAPVKRGPLEVIIQKATELGVSHLQPVVTARTVAPKLNIARLQAIATEAAEQCGRLSVPCVGDTVKFDGLMENWPGGRHLIFCDEAGDDESKKWGGKDGRAVPMLEALKNHASNTDQWAILIGPEGGFSPDERAALRTKGFVTPVTLGPRILRADTAAIASLTLWQAAHGDWRQT